MTRRRAVRAVQHCLAACALLATACMEPRVPFAAEDRAPLPPDILTRLTFGAGDNRMPSFSADGQSVLYAATRYEGGLERGRIVSIPSDGLGPARPLFRSLPPFHWTSAPRASPAGGRVAFVQVHDVRAPCRGLNVGMVCIGSPFQRFDELLNEVRIFVREPGTSRPITQDPMLRLELGAFSLVDDDYVFGGMPTEIIRVLPHQILFSGVGTFGLRADWSPDGARLVFSDGAGLHIWDVDADIAAPIPGTEYGISPAWSPDGEWIAYTRLVAGEEQQRTCRGTQFGETVCAVDQTVIPLLDRHLIVVRPDGSDEAFVGPGEEPAWGPGNVLYYRYLDQLWRRGEPDVALPGTGGGREPAVSPDGTRMAFTHRNQNGDYDLWVLRLDH